MACNQEQYLRAEQSPRQEIHPPQQHQAEQHHLQHRQQVTRP
jgi:hypothetical protein